MTVRRIYPKLDAFMQHCASADLADIALRDSRKMFAALNAIFTINQRVCGHLATRIAALASFGWTLNAFDKADQERAGAVRSRLFKTLEDIVMNHAHTPFFGSSLYKLGWAPTPEGTSIVIDEIYDAWRYEFDKDKVKIYESSASSASQMFDLAASDDLLMDEYQVPFRGGILRTIMPVEILRFDMHIENANYLRKLKGILQVINTGGGSEEQAAAEEAAANVVKNNYVITGPDIDFKLNSITAGGTDGFKMFKEQCDKDISIACLGQANAAELPNTGGSRAAMQVLRMISADIFYQDMVRVESLIARLLLLDYRLNISPAAQAKDVPWKFSFNIAEEKDIEKNSNAISTMIAAGIPMIRGEVYSLLGLTPPGKDDELFSPVGGAIV